MINLRGPMFDDLGGKSFLIEEPVPAKECQNVELVEIPDSYSENYLREKHYNWLALDEAHPKEPFIISILSKKPMPGVPNCLFNTKRGFLIFLTLWFC